MIKQFIRDIDPLWIRKIRRFFYRLHTVWQFAKLGWRDYWFDASHLENMIIFKLQQMISEFEKNAHLAGSPTVIKEMEYVLNLLLEARELEEKSFTELDAQYNPPNMIQTEDYVFDGLRISEWGYTPEYKEFLKTKSGKQYESKHSKLMIFIPKKRAALRKIAYNIIAENIENWFD